MSARFRFGALIFFWFGAIGCEADQDQGRSAGVPTARENPDGFFVERASPSEGSSSALPGTEIIFNLSQRVSLASVFRDTVTLRIRESKRTVPVSVKVSDDRLRLTVVPRSGLSPNGRYVLEVRNIVSDSGERLDIEHPFWTVFQSPAEYDGYHEGHLTRYYVAEALVPTCDEQCEDFSYSGSRIVEYKKVGADGLKNTSDDAAGYRTTYLFNHNRDSIETIVRASPGLDGLWETGDDEFLYHRASQWSKRGIERRFYKYAGEDGRIDTSDDIHQNLTQFYYDDQDRSTGYCLSDSGADGRAFTVDDETTSCEIKSYGQGFSKRVLASGAGDDGQWRTADDVFDANWSKTVFGQGGNELRVENYRMKGSTPDENVDELQTYSSFEASQAGSTLVSTQYQFADRGPDGVWFTSDDVKSLRVNFFKDWQGLAIKQSQAKAGADGVFDTSDDVLVDTFYW